MIQMNMFWIAMTTAIVPITIFLCQLSESMRPRKRYNGNIAAIRRTKDSSTVLTNKQEDGHYKGKEVRGKEIFTC